MSTPRRRVPTLLGIDPEYSKQLDTGPTDQPLTDQPMPTRVKADTNPPVPPRAARPKVERAPVKQVPPAEKSKVLVTLLLRPLTRHEKDLLALADRGFQIQSILALAMQQMRRKFRPHERYTTPEKMDFWLDYKVRFGFRADAPLISKLSDEAGDLGTLAPAELIKSQVHQAWIEQLDKTINKLKNG